MNKKLILQLIKAVIANNPNKVNRLLNQGVDPNECEDEALVSPLHYAAQHDAFDVIPLLIAAGADIYATTDPDEYTPLDIALMHQNYRVANLLISYLNLSKKLH